MCAIAAAVAGVHRAAATSAVPRPASVPAGSAVPELAFVRVPRRYLSEDWDGYSGDLYASTEGGIRALTTTPGHAERSPRWSPDGSLLAFTRSPMRCNARRKECFPTGNSSVWIMNADGSGLRRLTPPGFSNPVWSPDGRRLALAGCPPRTRCERSYGVYLIDGRGQNLRRLVRGLHFLHDWSRDGRYLLARSSDQLNIAPSLIEVRTGRLRHTFATRRAVWFGGRFSLDGTEIVFGTKSGVFLAALDGRRRRLVARARWPLGVSLSPDGQSVAFSAGSNDPNIFVADMATRTRRAVLSSRDGELFPDWRPQPSPR